MIKKSILTTEMFVELGLLFNKNQIIETRQLNSILNELYQVKKSKIHGSGVFATRDFHEEEFINVVAIMHNVRPEDVNFIITDFGKLINHSYEPNGELRDNAGVYTMYATQKIKNGDEMTVDYTKTKEFKQPESGWK